MLQISDPQQNTPVSWDDDYGANETVIGVLLSKNEDTTTQTPAEKYTFQYGNLVSKDDEPPRTDLTSNLQNYLTIMYTQIVSRQVKERELESAPT